MLTSFLAAHIAGAQDFTDVVLNDRPNGSLEAEQEALKRSERVTVVAPKQLRPQSDYHVLINLANSDVPVSIDLQLTGARDSNREQIEAKSILANSGETQTVKFSIGDWPPAEYILSVNAQAVDRSWNFTQEATLTYVVKSFSCFIQTDKAIYKPGQLVQLRALFLSQTLSPLPMREEINVTISDPKKNLIKHWIGLSNYRGLLSLEMPLSEDPILGDWIIKVEARKQEITKRFKVAEYILPTFDVAIQLPSYATYNESDIVASVKASYTYGKPVNGHVSLTVEPLVRFAGLDTRPLHQAQYRARLVNGSADIALDVVKDLHQKHDLFEREIEFFALVEEDLTGRKYNKTEVMKIYSKNVKIESLNGAESNFKPGLSYLLQLKVAYQDDTPVEDAGPELELRYGIPGRTLDSVRLRPVGGVVEHLIDIPKTVPAPGQPDRRIAPSQITLEVTYRNQVHYLERLYPYTSESEQYMQISLPQLQARNKRRRAPASPLPSINVNDDLKVRVQATEGMQQVTCQGLARGDIIWALSKDAKNQSDFEFEVKVDQRMAPEARILCFYVRAPNKEIIADSVSIQVGGLMRNLVKISTSREEAKPGQEVEVDVQTKPNSLVGVLGIDQSVLLLKTGNDIEQRDVTEEMKSYGSSGESISKWAARNADALFNMADVVVLTNNMVYKGFGYREGRLLYAGGVFAKMALHQPEDDGSRNIRLDSLVLGNEEPLNPPEFHIKKPKADPLVIRSFFPETWLWQNATTGQDGLASFKAKMPDTITSWVLSAFSLNEGSGLGLSQNRPTVRVFRPFFIKLNLPYSIVRGETVNIQAVIFNYSKRPTAAKVTLENREAEFEFVEAANDIEDEKRSSQQSETRLIRIPAEDGVAVSFLITPRKLGHIDIRVIAQSEFAGDGVVKKLLVKPEGQVQHFNEALLVNLGETQGRFKRNVSIEVPPNAVAGSQKVFVSAVGDLMGAGLSNVDDLLRLPYGCGEQNMINLVPNIVILNYLQSSQRLKEVQRARAVRNIEVGYQRQLNYKRSDGSFSAFGQADSNGSVWLTAYVLKTLQQAKSIITVDDKVIRRAANFIARFSRPEGSIEEVGMMHNKGLQSAGSAASTYLTAYAMIALLQRPVVPDEEAPAPVALDEVLDRGLNFLESQLERVARGESPYELAIIAYALNLANRRAAADEAYQQLWSRAQTREDDGELVWWSPDTEFKESGTGSDSDAAKLRSETNLSERESELKNKTSIPPLKPQPAAGKQSAHLFAPNSLSVEMSALALMTTVRRGELERALPIVRWLISQQNSNGGFSSTQDTVLAIEALAKFAEASAASKSPLSIDIDLLYPRSSSKQNAIRRNNIDQLLVTRSNALVNQQIRLPDNITWVQIQATGSGAAVVQVAWQYNLLVSAERPAFYLNPIRDKTSNINYLQLSVCTYYKAGQESNMAVMEVELPSGYVADVEALPGLKRAHDIKRIETADGDTKVVIYFDKLTREEICLTVPAHQVSKVSNNKPMPVTVYDYYNRQEAARIFYEPQPASSCDICDSDTCSEACSSARTKPKKSDRLISLHEQRRLSAGSGGSGDMNANLTSPTNGASWYRNSSAYQLLPLAPVLVAAMEMVRRL